MGSEGWTGKPSGWPLGHSQRGSSWPRYTTGVLRENCSEDSLRSTVSLVPRPSLLRDHRAAVKPLVLEGVDSRVSMTALPANGRRLLLRGGAGRRRPEGASMSQLRLMTGPVRAAAVTLWHHPDDGWSLMVAVRRDFEEWSESSPGYYDHLTLAEALDVLEASLTGLLARG